MIIERFFTEGSLSEVAIDSNIKSAIFDKYQSGKISSTMFNQAQSAVFLVMLDDAYPRFKQSPFYDSKQTSVYESND